MRAAFDEQLQTLEQELVQMGSLCESAIALSTKALSERDRAMARSVGEISARIDEKERQIESMCLRLLLQRQIESLCMKLYLRQQPVASDLRTVSAALKMVTDLERIGDNSGDIAEIVAQAPEASALDAEDVKDMARAVIQMVTDSVDAFVTKSVASARAVVDYDDIVDICFSRVKERLFRTLRAGEPAGEQALDMLMVAKYLERIGDHAANVAKWVIFSVTGEKEDLP